MESDVESIVQNLHSPDSDTREAALDALGSTKPDNAFTLILPFLADPEPAVRETALVNLGELGDERAIPYLLHSAQHETNESVRMYAIETLAQYQSPDILHFLLTEANQQSSMRGIRQAVSRQLAHYNTEEAVDALIPMLQDADPYVRVLAADALLTLNRTRLDPVWVDILLHYYHFHIAQTATKALAALRRIEPFDLLSAWLVDDQANIREAAAFACTYLDDSRIIPLLLERAATDPVVDVRDMALYALTEYRHPTIYAFLVTSVAQRQLSPRARELVAEQITNYDQAESIQVLIGLLDDMNATVRHTAADSLYRLNRQELADIWHDLLQQADPYLQRVATQALRQLASLST